MNKHTVIYCLLFFTLLSCGGMNDPIQEYLDRGEVNYLGKVDSAIAGGGNGRIQISWKINADPRIENCVISWNNQQDSLIYIIDRSKIVGGRIYATFDNMKEGSYVFMMYHTGKKGYNSVKQEVLGKVYGSLYQQTLVPRKIRKVSIIKENAEIEWSNAENSYQVNLQYINNKDKKITKVILSAEQKTVINDYTPGGEFIYETLFLPDEDAIDTFVVTSEILKFP